MKVMNRRDMLRLLGLASASYALSSARLPFQVGGRARAAAPAVPRRVVFMVTNHGTQREWVGNAGDMKPYWVPDVGTAPAATSITAPWSTSSFTLRDIHQPLVPYQKKIMLLDGLDMVSNTVDPTEAQDAHAAGWTQCLVANNRATAALAGSASIDQYIAQTINSPNPLTALPSLDVSISDKQVDHTSSMSYIGAKQPIPMMATLGKAYDRMFPNGPQMTDNSALMKQIAQQKNMLDFVQNNYTGIQAKLGKMDATRLATHGAAIADLEKRLSIGASATCTQPDRTVIAPGMDYQSNGDVMLGLVQVALACDLTRVVSINVDQAPDSIMGYKANTSGTSDFHDMIHKTNGDQPPLSADTVAMGMVDKYHTYNAGVFAKLLGLLDSIPEADGTTLLDNTLVVWSGEVAAGDHSLTNIPYVLGGGFGGAISTGRYVRLPRVADKTAWPAYSVGKAHNDLFVSIANGMGVSTNTFGNGSICKGPLAGLTA